MINAVSMRTIIKNTLESMTSYAYISDSDVNLIELTFLEQSDMCHLVISSGATQHGLMGWTYTQLEKFICEVVRINPKFAEDINNIALIDVHNDSIDDIWEACSYNIALQILLTYQFYRHALSDMPVGIDAVTAVYFKHWPNAQQNRKSNEAAKRLAKWTNEATRGRFIA